MIKEKESWQKMNKQIAVITGASSGFGLLTTLELAKKDYLVIATMRNLEKQGNLLSQVTQLNLQQNIKIQQLISLSAPHALSPLSLLQLQAPPQLDLHLIHTPFSFE